MVDAPVIETRGLRKSYGAVEALRGLDLSVPAGSICGFVGRNGAGKTTTIKLIMGMAFPTAGEANVFGLPCSERDAGVAIRQRTGFVSDEKDLFDFMSVADMISFTAGFYPGWRKDLEERYLRTFDLPSGRRVKALSRGMRTKLALLLAFCRGAELLILDEATSGLDPAAQEEVLQAIVGHVARERMTVFFSSHQINEVEQIADRVVVIDKGRLAISGLLDDLRESWRRIRLTFPDTARPLTFRSPGVERVKCDGRIMSVLCSAGADQVLEEAKSLSPAAVEVTPVTLKEMFLETVVEEA